MYYYTSVLLLISINKKCCGQGGDAVIGSPCVTTIVVRRSWKSLRYDIWCSAATGSSRGTVARFYLLLGCAWRPLGGQGVLL